MATQATPSGNQAPNDRFGNRTAIWAAVIGVIGVVLGGLLAVFSGWIGGYYGYKSAVHTAKAQAAQAQADFLRMQRVIAYRKFETDVTNETVLARQLDHLGPNPAKTTSTVAAINSYETTATAMQVDYVDVLIIGSDDAGTKAESLRNVMFAFGHYLAGDTRGYTFTNVSDKDFYKDFYKDYGHIMSHEYNSALDAFLNRAHADENAS